MNYKIIGQDGKEYGPISGDQMRQWISENRVESRTPIFLNGARDWTFVGLLPEFANYFAPQIPSTISALGSPRKHNGFAVTGMILGIASWIFCFWCYSFPWSILGIVFSATALSQINRQPEIYEGRSYAIVGLILSISALLFYGVIFAIQAAIFCIFWNLP